MMTGRHWYGLMLDRGGIRVSFKYRVRLQFFGRRWLVGFMRGWRIVWGWIVWRRMVRGWSMPWRMRWWRPSLLRTTLSAMPRWVSAKEARRPRQLHRQGPA